MSKFYPNAQDSDEVGLPPPPEPPDERGGNRYVLAARLLGGRIDPASNVPMAVLKLIVIFGGVCRERHDVIHTRVGQPIGLRYRSHMVAVPPPAIAVRHQFFFVEKIRGRSQSVRLELRHAHERQRIVATRMCCFGLVKIDIVEMNCN
jgi:hypothetical protein